MFWRDFFYHVKTFSKIEHKVKACVSPVGVMQLNAIQVLKVYVRWNKKQTFKE